MDRKLGTAAVESQRYNATSNRCESLHRTSQRSVPKSITFPRTYKHSFAPMTTLFKSKCAKGVTEEEG